MRALFFPCVSMTIYCNWQVSKRGILWKRRNPLWSTEGYFRMIRICAGWFLWIINFSKDLIPWNYAVNFKYLRQFIKVYWIYVTVYRVTFAPCKFSPFYTCIHFRPVLNSLRQNCVLREIVRDVRIRTVVNLPAGKKWRNGR